MIMIWTAWTKTVYVHNGSFFLKDVTDTVEELVLVEIQSESDVSIVRNYCAVNKVKKLVIFQLFSFEKLTHR